MALAPLSAADLASTPTVLDSFMGCVDRGQKTVGQLLEIYRDRRAALERCGEHSEHLRVERFKHDMTARRWRTDVVMRIGVFDGTVLVIDGIHRAIAYLACLEDGASPRALPALCVEV